VGEGGTTADGAVHAAEGECLGACADAPVMLVNDRQMCSFMTPDKLDDAVAELLRK
jgi:NADH-quinone oxidoreductase subunit E